MRQYLPYISLVVGLTGLSLGIYYHSQAVKVREPLYYVGNRATIVDGSVSTPSPIKVLYNGKPVGESESVIATTVYFWNTGKQPIKPDDLLEPISIQLGGSSEILETRLLRVTRDVTEFASSNKQENSESAKHVVPISFRILEQNDGGAIQIIYAGKADAPITVAGTIVEAGSPKQFETYKAIAEHPPNARKIFSVVAVSMGLSLLVGALLAVLMSTQRPGWSSLKYAALFVVVNFVGMLIVVHYLSFGPTIPPALLQSLGGGSSSF